MNRNHHYFYQVQGQLNITQRDYCIFAIWTPKSVKTVRVNRDNDFWQNQMLPSLTRFYFECILPEILDSRFNRHMPIRDPKYIIEAKEKLSKNIADRNTKQQHITTANISKISLKEETLTEKRLKYNNISTKTSAVSTAVQEQEDCFIVGYYKKEPTTEDNSRRKKVLDDTIVPLSIIETNVLSKYNQLTDESMDAFLRIVRETSGFSTQSVQYLEYANLITPCYNKSVQIIGGNCTGHWRCIYFDGAKLHVYDSLPGCTYNRLADKEKAYISARFPQIASNDIIFEKVQRQPDATSCGLFAAAFATDIVLGKSPCKNKYSNDVESLRRHFYTIVANNKLLPFPK